MECQAAVASFVSRPWKITFLWRRAGQLWPTLLHKDPVKDHEDTRVKDLSVGFLEEPEHTL